MNWILTVISRVILLFILLVLSAIAIFSCVQINDRRSFYKEIKEATIEDVKKLAYASKDSIVSFVDSSEVQTKNHSAELDEKNKSPQQRNDNLYTSQLEILSKSNGLIDANGLTFCVSLIVALLSSMLLFRITSMERLVEENRRLRRRTELYYTHALRIYSLRRSLENVYITSVIIEDLSNNLY